MNDDYREMILPIMGERDGEVITHLGTGCFIKFGKRRLMATAYHAISNWDADLMVYTPPKPYHTLPYPAWNFDAFRAVVVEENLAADIALLEIRKHSPPDAFELGKDEEINTMELVMSLEYSTTRKENGVHIFSPATRIGNVTRVFKQLDIPSIAEKARNSAFEVSFPALSGASGAPIMPQFSHRLWGLLIANADYELLPVRAIKNEDREKGSREEIKYMAPHGIAVNVKHIVEML